MTDGYWVLSIDPGKSSGLALLYYDETSVDLVDAWQIEGGVQGLVEFLKLNCPNGPLVITEKFTARATHGFSYTTDSLEPLRGEGALIALGLMPDYSPGEKRWRDPKLQYLVGGKDKADKKKRQHKFLKDSGFYVTPKSLGTADADDVRSALAHGLTYLQRDLKHRGVHDMVSRWMEAN